MSGARILVFSLLHNMIVFPGFSRKSNFVILIENFCMSFGDLFHSVTSQNYFMYVTIRKDLLDLRYWHQSRIYQRHKKKGTYPVSRDNG